jgi:hypothetical protein
MNSNVNIQMCVCKWEYIARIGKNGGGVLYYHMKQMK